MKKIYVIVMLVLASVLAQAQTSVWDGSRQLWTRGSGTQDDPFLIESAANLAYLSYMVGKAFDTQGLFFKLTTDIDLNGSEDLQWIPIGRWSNGYNEDGCERHTIPVNGQRDVMFKGHFDGDNHVISNIYVNQENDVAGLFGFVGSAQTEQTVVENVLVVSGFVKGYFSGGIVAICGSRSEVLVSRCLNGADVEGVFSGGIVGSQADKVYNCNNIGSVNGQRAAGGIVGECVNEIVECYNSGYVGGDGYGGGLLGGGSKQRGLLLNNSYNSGDLSFTGNLVGLLPANTGPVGGLVGSAWSGTNTMTNCYNVGRVFCGNYESGALVGGFNGEITNCYYLNTCGAAGDGEPKTSDEMRDPLFVDILNYETDVWCADTLNTNNGYPILGANNLTVNELASNELTIYPNPNHGKFTVEGTGLLTVFNVLGQAILTREVKEQTVLELPKGLYFIRLEGRIVSTQKVVVTH